MTLSRKSTWIIKVKIAKLLALDTYLGLPCVPWERPQFIITLPSLVAIPSICGFLNHFRYKVTALHALIDDHAVILDQIL